MSSAQVNLSEEIEKRSRQFEDRFAAGDVNGVLDTYYHDTAWMSPPGAPLLKGRDGIAGFFNVAITIYKSLELELVELREVDAVTYELGRAVLTPKDSNQDPLHCRYLVIWQNIDGVWRVSMDFFAPGEL